MFPVSTRPAGLILIDAMSEIEIMTELKVTAMLGFIECKVSGQFATTFRLINLSPTFSNDGVAWCIRFVLNQVPRKGW